MYIYIYIVPFDSQRTPDLGNQNCVHVMVFQVLPTVVLFSPRCAFGWTEKTGYPYTKSIFWCSSNVSYRTWHWYLFSDLPLLLPTDLHCVTWHEHEHEHQHDMTWHQMLLSNTRRFASLRYSMGVAFIPIVGYLFWCSDITVFLLVTSLIWIQVWEHSRNLWGFHFQ